MMKIWNFDTNEGWQPSPPPAGLEMLRQTHTPQKRFLIIRKEADGRCILRMQLPECAEKEIAVSDLTETQARNIAIAYLEQKGIDSANLEEMAAEAELPTGAAMFPEWFRGNYNSAPECMSKAAACLRMRRFSAGTGVKLIIADNADFNDESRADIILSGTDEIKKKPTPEDELRAVTLLVGVALLSALGVGFLVKCLRKKR